MVTDADLEEARPYVPFDPFADPDGFPLCCISKRAVVYSCGMIAHQGDEVDHDHPPGEVALCRRLAEHAAKIMDGVEVGMGTEGTPFYGTDYFRPFFIAANRGMRPPARVTERQVRAAFGGVIFPRCIVRVEPLRERGVWWKSVLRAYSDFDHSEDEAGYRAGKLRRWRRMVEWFRSQAAFRTTAFVMIGDGPEHGGATFPRLTVGVTEAGSLAGIIGGVVHT